MIIDVTGFGWSGSGAVHDLLREYDDVKFAAFDYDWEFTLLWEPDGIYDLEHKLCYKHCRFGDSNVAIKRFLSLVNAQNRASFLHYNEIFKGNYLQIVNHYIDSLIDFEFQGHTFEEVLYPNSTERILSIYNRIISKLLGNRIVVGLTKRDYSRSLIRQNKHTIKVSYNPDNFILKTHNLMNELFSYVRDNNNTIPIVTDQLFPPDCPSLFFKYIQEPSKCIVVRRDPRDTYLLAKQAYHSNMPIPVGDVDDFILFYKKTIRDTRESDSQSLLNIQFEDLIYNYQSTKLLIEGFLGISKHVRRGDVFDPKESINNTQLFNLYSGYEKDIIKIENELKDCLFPFENYPALGKVRKEVF